MNASVFPLSLPGVTAGSGDALSNMSPAGLVERLRDENALYLQGARSDPRFAYELFRRAFLQGDQRAWEALYGQYSPLVQRWVEHHSGFSAAGEDAACLVNGAFIRMWRAFVNDREKFARVRNLASLLRYLKLCVHSEILDQVRKVQNERAMQDESSDSDDVVVEQQEKFAGADALEQTQLWRLIQNHLNDPQEQTAMYERFVLGMKPNAIYQDHPDLFASVREVYGVLQNVLRRLRRSDELLTYLAELNFQGQRMFS